MKTIRNFLKSNIFIHAMVPLGLFALWGVIETKNMYILFGVAMSFLGAICGSFIRVIDAIEKN